VEPAIDPHDRLPLSRETARLVLTHTLGQRQTPRNVLVPVESLVIGRRRQDRHELWTSFGGETDGVEHHAVRLAGQRLPVRHELRVVGQHVVRADLMAEMRGWRGELRRLRVDRRNEREAHDRGEKGARHRRGHA
jgi:hypothetical protein